MSSKNRNIKYFFPEFVFLGHIKVFVDFTDMTQRDVQNKSNIILHTRHMNSRPVLFAVLKEGYFEAR